MAESQPICVRSGRQWVIYVLIDPRTQEIRYVGVTARKLNWRINEHISRAQKGGKTYRDNWIRQVLHDGHRPILLPIEVADAAGWVARERYWIVFYRAAGARLTNLTDGGEGNSGYVPTAELRAKWSAMRRGKKYAPGRQGAMLGKHHTPEAREAIAEAGRGRHHTQESKAKLSAKHRGKTISESQKAILRACRLGSTLSPEHRQKIQASIPHKKPVRRISTGEVFPSIKAAARAVGVKPNSIAQALHKACRSAGSYWEYANA